MSAPLSTFNVRPQTQHGFTLIELVVVIVILGILAATALPKFSDMRTEARIAQVQATMGAVQSMSGMVFSKCQMIPACAATRTDPTIVEGAYLMTVQGSPVNISFGYPNAGNYPATNNVENGLISIKGMTISTPDTIRSRFVPNGANDPTNCYFEYQQAGGMTEIPTYTTVTTGC